MPLMSDIINNPKTNPTYFRLLFYGYPKTRKTWLAATAIQAGFNTILLDFDKGHDIIKGKFTQEQYKRLLVVNAHDSLTNATCCTFLTSFLKNGTINFNESTRKEIVYGQAIDEHCINLSINKHINKNCVLIVDSYTSLIKSLTFKYAKENNIDLSLAAKDEWPGYGWTGMLATWILDQLSKLECHVILIGHKSVYEKYK